jgi:tetratricopeptide (TPR) repeat protein
MPKKSSTSFLKKITPDGRVAAILIIIGMAGAVFAWFWAQSHKDNSGNSVTIKTGNNNSGQVIGNIDSNGGPITIINIQNDTNALADKIIRQQAEEISKLKTENSQVKRYLANSINRVKELEKGDRRDDAIAALDAIRKSGDTTKLLILIADKNLNKNTIERNREISAIAYLRGDFDTALAAINEILKLLPDDLDALNRKGNICQLRGNLPQAIQCYEKVLRLAKTQND